MRALLLAALVALVAPPVAAQQIQIKASGGVALGDYREQSEVLDFRGSGPSGHLDVTWRRWGLRADAQRIGFEPTDADSPAEGFDMLETELSVRFRPLVKFPAELEVGVHRHSPSPANGAQALRTFRLGATTHLVLGEGAELDARGAWLVGSDFSGGGTAKTALSLGLRAAYRPLARFSWAWLVADYQFERFDRETVSPVPIQGSTVTLGVEWRFAH